MSPLMDSHRDDLIVSDRNLELVALDELLVLLNSCRIDLALNRASSHDLILALARIELRIVWLNLKYQLPEKRRQELLRNQELLRLALDQHPRPQNQRL